MAPPPPRPTPIIRPRLPRILRPRRRISRRRALRPGRRLLEPPSPTTSPSPTPPSIPPLPPRLRHIIVHALPARRPPAAALRIALHLLRLLLRAARLLLLVLLLLERELVLRVVAGGAAAAGGVVRAACAAVVVAGLEALRAHAHAVPAALRGHGLHLLHLLHHHGVHAALGAGALRGHGRGGAALWLLLLGGHLGLHGLHGLHLLVLLHLGHHGWVHGVALHGCHLLLRGGEVGLHLGPVLRHHLGGHGWALGVLLASLALVLVRVVVVVVAVVEVFASASTTATAAATAAASVVHVFFLAHVAARLRFLDFDWFVLEHQIALQGELDGGLAVKGHEAEAARAVGDFVDHERGVDDAPELREVVFEVLLVGFLAHAADEDLGRAFLLVAGDGALGVDLEIGKFTFMLGVLGADGRMGEGVERRLVLPPGSIGRGGNESPYYFAVEEVLLDHDHVDGARVFEGEETETARAPRGAVAHDGAFLDFAEFGKVVLE